ncbi:hypothetical protein OOJ91_00365 [Micromonospora lupini]|uniref:hypothetical protein n=1 Tax=Micromonospora lupini TaxID=285679 RepID=UPI00225A9D42|nr:hypothetical protein [Micromonospora lupini]MCX5064314.1 hypothetical protein [Micromonospora lupini]
MWYGRVVLDQTGRARVPLPDWFGALHTDLCYLLTALGRPAPQLHVAEEFDGTGFVVAGGSAGGVARIDALTSDVEAGRELAYTTDIPQHS